MTEILRNALFATNSDLLDTMKALKLILLHNDTEIQNVLKKK